MTNRCSEAVQSHNSIGYSCQAKMTMSIFRRLCHGRKNFLRSFIRAKSDLTERTWQIRDHTQLEHRVSWEGLASPSTVKHPKMKIHLSTWMPMNTESSLCACDSAYLQVCMQLAILTSWAKKRLIFSLDRLVMTTSSMKSWRCPD